MKTYQSTSVQATPDEESIDFNYPTQKLTMHEESLCGDEVICLDSKSNADEELVVSASITSDLSPVEKP